MISGSTSTIAATKDDRKIFKKIFRQGTERRRPAYKKSRTTRTCARRWGCGEAAEPDFFKKIHKSVSPSLKLFG